MGLQPRCRTIKQYIMKREELNRIAAHFMNLYYEEIANDEVTDDMINEWWHQTASQYGYDFEHASEVYPEVEQYICKMSENTYDVEFDDNNDSNSKNINSSYHNCLSWIETSRGTSYFNDYKGGTVSIVCLETGDFMYQEEIDNK